MLITGWGKQLGCINFVICFTSESTLKIIQKNVRKWKCTFSFISFWFFLSFSWFFFRALQSHKYALGEFNHGQNFIATHWGFQLYWINHNRGVVHEVRHATYMVYVAFIIWLIIMLSIWWLKADILEIILSPYLVHLQC